MQIIVRTSIVPLIMLILGIKLCVIKRDFNIYEQEWQLKFISFIFLYLLSLILLPNYEKDEVSVY